MKQSKVLTKRVLALILTFMMVFGTLTATLVAMLPATVIAVGPTSDEQIEFKGETLLFDENGDEVKNKNDAWVEISKTVEGTNVETNR